MYIRIVHAANRLMRGDYRLIYPQSIHINSEKLFRKSDRAEVSVKMVDGRVKSQVQKALSNLRDELIKNTLTHLGNYSYHLFAYIYRGDDEIERGNTNLTDLDKADKLYERMAVLTLYNQIIYNLNPMADLYYLDLATRSLPVQTADTETDTTPIHYMGDILCGYIGDKIRGKINYDLIEEACAAIPQPIEIRYYDKADIYFGEMVDAVKNSDLKSYYSLRYDFTSERLSGEAYYKKHWIAKTDQEIVERIEKDESFRSALIQSLPEIYKYCDEGVNAMTVEELRMLLKEKVTYMYE